MSTMCLPQFAQAPYTKRSFVKVGKTQETTSETMEPFKKKVRFVGVDTCETAQEADVSCERTRMASSPQQLERLMEKVRRRAERRKRRAMRSPPPPPPPEDEPAQKPRVDLASMKLKLQRVEQAIKDSARMELELMNQSKKLRDERAGLTRKYESMAQQLREMQSAQNPDGQVFQMGHLPPLMVRTRRISATQDQITKMTM